MALRGNRPPRELTTEREGQAWLLRQKGYTLEQIGEQLGINFGNVGKLLNKLNDKYLRENLNQVERIKVEQTRILWWIGAEAMRAWEASKLPLSRVTEGEDGQTVRTAISREGNISYLREAREAMADIRSIWGCDVAPAQQDATQGIAQLIRDIEERGIAVEVRTTEPRSTDPGGLSPGAGTGADEVPEQPGPVQ